MKALDTQYKGFRFRSRLEARHAVFLDALSVVWSYESEGFDLDDGDYYLPDFLLPDFDSYLEVKGQLPNADEIRKCRKLQFHTSSDVWLSYGLPGENDVLLFGWTDKNGGSFIERWVKWGELLDTNIDDGATLARQARFEHGEYPNSRRLNNIVDYDKIAF